MKESALERKVVAHCKAVGVLCYKFSSPSRRGVPDRILLYRGRTMFLELKAKGGRLSKLQERELSVLRAAGFFCAWASDLPLARRLIDAFLQSTDLDHVL